jgi:hypothetical protein
VRGHQLCRVPGHHSEQREVEDHYHYDGYECVEYPLPKDASEGGQIHTASSMAMPVRVSALDAFLGIEREMKE